MKEGDKEEMSFALTGREQIVIYGAGQQGKETANLFSKNGFNVKAFLDKRADEVKAIELDKSVVRVFDLENYALESKDEVAIISLCNGLHHNQVAEQLQSIGFKNIIYIPLGFCGNRMLMSKMRRVFNKITTGKCLWDDIPEYHEITVNEPVDAVDGNTVIYMPIENLFVQESFAVKMEELKGAEYVKRKNSLKYLGDNLFNFKPYYQLFNYLDRANGECAAYTDLQVNDWGERHGEEEKRVLRDRYKLFQMFEKAYSIDKDFFIDSAPNVVWNWGGVF